MARKRNSEIHVHVADWGAGRSLMLRYRCPKTGETFTRSAETKLRKEAQKAAGKWEDELRSGKYKPASKTTWEEFRLRYENECVIPEMRDSSLVRVSGVFDAVERIINPELLSEVDGNAIDLLKRTLRLERLSRTKAGETVEETVKRSDATVRTHMAILKAALNWAQEREILSDVPKMSMPPIAKNPSKGRPITLEEFERIIGKVPEKCRRHAGDWQRFLWGLWWSGLRLEEALTLTWDNRIAPHIDLDGENSTITIPAECQKNGETTVGPIVPEFYEFLAATQEVERTGFVFSLPFREKHEVCRAVSRIGKAAGVKVSDKAGRGGTAKFATCHDLRRSFGLRWALRVMPPVLQALMRHADINTTMKYYVGNNVAEMSRTIWAAFKTSEIEKGNSLGNEALENTQKMR
jgi:integrase